MYRKIMGFLEAWKENEQAKNVISYEYAFELIQI